METRLLGASYVEVVTSVHLVMKNKGRSLTPGKLLIAVPLDVDWPCGCPGVKNFTIGDTYLITGFVQPTHYQLKPSGYVLKVDHNSIVMPWSERILDDMVKNRAAYPGLIFRPNLKLYRMYYG